MTKIKTVCIIGAGVMGSGIAAQAANSKTNVILLDVASDNPEDRNSIAAKACDNLLVQKPPPLAHPNYAKYIKPGNLEDDLQLIKEADLVIEAIVEKLEIKHDLYNSIYKYLKSSAILASNTSTIPLAKLKEKLPPGLRERFIITHFFNPPRYMELVELVTDRETLPSIIPHLSEFLSIFLGKSIVNCNDTPGFIANRTGCFLLELVVRSAIRQNLDPVKIDYIFSSCLGFPSTGIFGLYDLIGHDVMELISASLLKSLPDNDRYHQVYIPSPLHEKMREKNLRGRKTGGGFYLLSKDGAGKKIKQVIDFTILDYREASQQGKYGSIAEVLGSGDEYGMFISAMLKEFFGYVISLLPEVTGNREDIDQAMKLGYSLKYGPFELLDKMPGGGATWLKSVGIDVPVPPPHPERTKSPAWGAGERPILDNDSAELRAIGGRHVFSIKSKMSLLDVNVFNLLIESVRYCEEKADALYIFPSGDNFSAGANLRYFKNSIENDAHKALERLLTLGQEAMLSVKYAKIPVISCARGVAVGGGCELLLHSAGIIANQNLSAGLVELGVGLIPAWGGTKEMVVRSKGDKARLVRNLKNILQQNKSSSAEYFSLDYSASCVINMNRNLILQDAFNLSLGEYRPNDLGSGADKIKLPYLNLQEEIDHAGYDPLQMDVLDFFQKIIDKKAITEEQLLELEREKFLQLAFKPLALERISKFV